jgi:hypothetical protein
LSNNSNKLHVLGDSFSTPNYCVDPQQSFWGLAAQDLGIKHIVNYSHVGFSFDHVIHILLNENFDFTNDYFLVGIPPLVRYVAYNDNSDNVWHSTHFDSVFNSNVEEIASLHKTQRFTFKEQFVNDRDGVDRFNVEWNEVQNIEKIFLLAQYLKSFGSKFMMVNLAPPLLYQNQWHVGKNIIVKTKNLKECIVFEDTYYSVNLADQIKPVDYNEFGYNGHHGPVGNANWYNKILKPKMIELGWIND